MQSSISSWIALSLLIGACYDGHLGWTRESQCHGKEITCTPPETYEGVEAKPAGWVPIEDVPALTEEWSEPLDCAGIPFLGGAGSTVWVFCNQGETLVAKQFDATGHVGDRVLTAPDEILRQGSNPTFLTFTRTSTPDGPIVGLDWFVDCEEQTPCSYRELILLTNDVSANPTRISSTHAAPDVLDALLSYTLADPESGGYFTFGLDSFWSIARMNAQGNLLWRQDAFPEDYRFEPTELSRTFALSPSTFSVLGHSPSAGSALFDIDKKTGNLSARSLHGVSDSAAKFRYDAQGRLVLAHQTGSGNLGFLRIDSEGAREVILQRRDYTLLSALDIAADDHGSSYVLSATGGAKDIALMICRIDDALKVTCGQLPQAFMGGFEIFLGIDIDIDLSSLFEPNTAFAGPFAFVSVSGDGSVYTLSKDRALVRYRLPEASPE